MTTKDQINAEIQKYSAHVLERTNEVYGQYSKEVAATYFDILNRGGKRLRGELTIIGYQLCGGQDIPMILQAARAIEMMHAYMLIIDDIQDRSDLRRGAPSAHRMLEAIHSDAHIGTSLAMNAALFGSHAANMTLAMLQAPYELKVKALNIMNHTVLVTTHGQTNDIVNELRSDVTEQDIKNVMQWKTAHYSVLNPLHMGMVLAGAGCEDTNAITPFALDFGKAYQIADDMLVTADSNDKNAIDDIREGKRTLISVYALNHANPKDKQKLLQYLGDRNVSQEEFEECKQIFVQTGAIDYAKEKMNLYKTEALRSLNQHERKWATSSVDRLQKLTKII